MLYDGYGFSQVCFKSYGACMIYHSNLVKEPCRQF